MRGASAAKSTRGYYELYHQATAKGSTKEISLSLIHVEEIDLDRSVIKCELHDNNGVRPYLHLVGHIAPRLGFLYWELGPDSQGPVCHAISYSPKGKMSPGKTILRGIFLTVSGDDKYEYLVAAKGAMRFLGEELSVAIEHCIIDISADDSNLEHLLQRRFGGYLSDLLENEAIKQDVLEKEVEQKILSMINNAIPTDATPLALVLP